MLRRVHHQNRTTQEEGLRAKMLRFADEGGENWRKTAEELDSELETQLVIK